jgi:lysyl endopeptidase
MKITFTLLLFLCSLAGIAQVTNERSPQSFKVPGLEEVSPIAMPGFNLEALKKEDAINDPGKNKPWRFGYEFMVDHNLGNSGSWHTLQNGDRIWRIRFTSEGAKTMNFLFSDFYMPQGATIYLYSQDHSDILGAYDARQNNPERVLGTWLVKGSDVYIEYYEPAAVAGQGRLEIFKVVHGYRTHSEGFLKAPDDGLNNSGDCNYDVDCYIEDIEQYKEINKKAVGLIVVNNSSYCTGSLVNNTANDGTPYFLTADHCYSNPSQWAFMFNWISPNPVCAATTPSTNNAPEYYLTLSGATLRARREQSDFCLVEITANVPAEWDLVYAGWDRSTTAPQSVFGIHHPAGDIMKTCVDYGPLTTEPTMWRIEDWDLGVTEGGSSGSPLYDFNGRLRGQLYGGWAACAGTNDNGDYDAYGRFDVSWDAGNSASSRLREWLDPDNTGQTTLDYYPPQVVYAVDARSTIVQTGLDECTGTLQPQVRITNKGTQTLTSATISYQLNGATPSTYSWTGNLATGQADEVYLPEITASNGENTFTVTITQPNGTTDGNPADNTSSNDFEVRVYELQEVTFNLTTDDFGDETSWELTNEDGDVVESGSGYNSNQEYEETFELATGCYTFTIFDGYSDGICCEFGNGSYQLSLEDGTVVVSGGSFGGEEATGFSLQEELGTGSHALQNAVTVYPNPSNGIYTVTITNGMQPQYAVYTVPGQQLMAGTITANGTINLSGAANGIYLLKLQDTATGATVTFKLVKE